MDKELRKIQGRQTTGKQWFCWSVSLATSLTAFHNSFQANQSCFNVTIWKNDGKIQTTELNWRAVQVKKNKQEQHRRQISWPMAREKVAHYNSKWVTAR